jgi:sulfite exporter TauE/SafE
MVIKIKKQTLFILAVCMATIVIGFLLLRYISLETISANSNINLWAIFLTGLITGGLTCLAVQGGLLAATIAQRESSFAPPSPKWLRRPSNAMADKEEKLKDNMLRHRSAQASQSGNALPIFTFLVAKLVAYTAFGFLLGWFGSLFQLSLTAQIVMQVAVAIFMIGTALSILNVHPIFRYFIIQPPKSLTRIVRNQSKSKSLFAPALLGAFTVFIPCGTTQAMMALAIGSGSPLLGAAVLFAFIFGTSPLFFTLGYFATRLGESLHQKFMKVAAVVLIILAIFNLNNVLALTGSSWTVNNLAKQTGNVSTNQSPAKPSQHVAITIHNNGYTPNSVTVKAGADVTFKIQNEGVYSCASAFTIPYFNYQKIVQAGESETISLKMPDKPTQIPFMCSMGMYRGVINVL